MNGLFEGWHIVILVLVVLVIFGSSKLPIAARSIGKSMRILKTEVQGLHDDTPDAPVQTMTIQPAQPQVQAPQIQTAQPQADTQAQIDALQKQLDALQQQQAK